MHPLQQKIDVLRRRLRRLLVVYGLGWTLAAGLAVALFWGTLDYLFRFEDEGIRIIATLSVVLAAGWTAWRRLVRGLSWRPRDVELACRVQRCFPALDDRLASAVEFVQDGDATASAALRQAVIEQTTAAADHVELRRALARGPAVRAGLAALAVGAVVAAAAVAEPAAFRAAALRLAQPTAAIPWPQRTHLVVRRAVDQLARGRPFDVEVADAFGRRLPADTRIFFRFERPGGAAAEESQLLRPAGKAMLARRENVTQSFSYRIAGGDDASMDWRRVEVFDPPEIAALEIKVRAPAYTGWEDELVEGDFRALAGSTLTVRGTATRPLRWATLCFSDGRSFAAQRANDPPGAESSRRFALPAAGAITIDKPATYWFRLEDARGFAADSPIRWQIHAVADAAPTVSLEEPQPDRLVTPRAVLPVRVSAKDDLRVRWIEIRSRAAEGNSPWRVWRVYEGPAAPPAARGTLGADGNRVDAQTFEAKWNLADPARPPADEPLRPGMRLIVQAFAGDYRGQEGHSPPCRLTVIGPDEVSARLAARQGEIFVELTRVQALQRQTRDHLQALLARPGGQLLTQGDADQLRGAEMSQRQVRQALAGTEQSVRTKVRAVLEDADSAPSAPGGTAARMRGLLAALEQLEGRPLPAIQRALSSAVKAAQVQGDPPPLAAPLADAVRGQDAVLSILAQLLGGLDRWDRGRRFQAEIAGALADQRHLTPRCELVGRRTLTRPLAELAGHEREDLSRLAREQLELALRLEAALGRGEEAATSPDPADAATEAVAEALRAARALGLSDQMRTAAAELGSNQVGQANARQQRAEAGLVEILSLLKAGRDAPWSARAGESVTPLVARQREILETSRRLEREIAGREPSATQAETLRTAAAAQRSLESQTRTLTGRLAERPAFREGLAAAADAMALAAALLDRQQTAAATQEAQRTALVRLEAVVAALQPPTAAEVQASKSEPPSPPGRRLDYNQLKLIRLTQEELNRRTAAAAASDTARGNLDDLGVQQTRLAETLLAAAGAAPGKEATPDADPIDKIARDMRRAGGLLQQGQPGAATRQVQEGILKDLDALLAQAVAQAAQPSAAQGAVQKPPGTPDNGQSGPAGHAPDGATTRQGTIQPAPPERTPEQRLEDLRETMRRLWNDLPPSERQQLQDAAGEELVPQYAPLIEAYFKDLAKTPARPPAAPKQGGQR